MAIYEHVSTFAGRPVVAYEPPLAEPPADPGAVAWRVASDYDGGQDLFEVRWRQLLDEPWADRVSALVIGEWGECYENDAPVALLAAAAATLTSLKALFLGELTMDESEISWIQHTDVTPLLAAFPGLEVLRIRGSAGLDFQAGSYPGLREFAIESGGLPAGVVSAVAASEFPDLRHLELWLGTNMYEGDATVEDLAPILGGARLPVVRRLGLRDAEIADQVAAALAGAPVVAQLDGLDLSLGVLSDVGAAALLAGQPLTHLKVLDLHHHFLSDAMMERLTAELHPFGVSVNLDQAEGADSEDRFVAVAE